MNWKKWDIWKGKWMQKKVNQQYCFSESLSLNILHNWLCGKR